MNINKVIQETKKFSKTRLGDPSLIDVLISIEGTIQHITKLYSSPRITKDKKEYLEKTIKDADTRAMAILVILRNRKDFK